MNNTSFVAISRRDEDAGPGTKSWELILSMLKLAIEQSNISGEVRWVPGGLSQRDPGDPILLILLLRG